MELSSNSLSDQALPSLSNLGSLRERVAAVTGAAHGIGLACVRRLAEAGADVALLDLDEPGALGAAEDVASEFGVRALGRKVDSADAAARDAIDIVTAELGGLHIWVNNAGIFPEISTLDITDSDYDKLMCPALGDWCLLELLCS